MSIEANKQVIQRFVDEVLNQKNLDAIDRLVTPGFEEQDPFPGQGPGPAGLRYAVGLFTSAFPDLHWVIEQQLGEGETVVSRFVWTGTQHGEFLGIPPTGKKVRVWGVVIDEVRGGRMDKSRIMMDTMGLMQQLGVVPG